jgi:rubrerythrin
MRRRGKSRRPLTAGRSNHLVEKEDKMAEFLNPFQGNLPDRVLSLGELIRAIRQDIAAEEEATHLYTAQAEATDNALAKRVLLDIADEERVHVGEFSRLLSILTEGEEDKFLAEGAEEVNEMAAESGVPGFEAAGNDMTIGSLRD